MLNKETRPQSGLKIADINDLQEIKRMVLLFKNNSPYKDFLVDEDKIEELIGSLLTAGPTDCVILLSIIEDKPVGLLIGLAKEFLFSREKHATELAWWVDLEYRGSSGRELYEAFAFWAKKVGCKYLNMSMLENKDLAKIKKIYKAQGYRPLEHGWIKEI